MAILIKHQHKRTEHWDLVPLAQFPRDMRRMLTVQVKELVHTIEDHEDGISLAGRVDLISFFQWFHETA